MRQESYQLLIGLRYTSGTYGGTDDRKEFYNQISSGFVDEIVREGRHLELGIFNGLRINPETGDPERIQQLEEGLASSLVESILDKLKRSPVMTFSTALRN